MASIFISHATEDQEFVKQLQEKLEGQGKSAQIDSHTLHTGDQLDPQIKQSIEAASCFLLVVSIHALNSQWVQKEVRYALEVEQKRPSDFQIIPLLFGWVQPSALKLFFKDESRAEPIQLASGGLDETMPALLAALNG